jgi:hypothetical protein
MSDRKGFNFLKSYHDVFQLLDNDKDKADFMKCVFNKQFHGINPDFTNLSAMCKMAYVSQKHSLDKSVKGFEDKTGKKMTPLERSFEGNEEPLERSFEGNSKPLEHSFEQVQEEVQVQVQEKEEEEEEEKYSLVPKTKKVFEEKINNTYNSCLIFFEEHLRPVDEKQENSWKETIEKLNRIEKIPLAKIIEITEKARADDFTRKNSFHSLNKLRTKKEGMYYITIFNEKFKNNGNTNGKSVAEIGKRAMESEIAKNFRVL